MEQKSQNPAKKKHKEIFFSFNIIRLRSEYNWEKQTAMNTLIAAASVGDLSASKGWASTVLRDLKPAAFPSILIPLSAVVTARRFPSLLNLKRGRL